MTDRMRMTVSWDLVVPRWAVTDPARAGRALVPHLLRRARQQTDMICYGLLALVGQAFWAGVFIGTIVSWLVFFVIR